ncbi:MAG: hypothetical protein ALECFALPRED_006343 [Alectoria fallacina]|uniref:Uncharacterized protein n=1 Tax=Alectoria fallacina TaxID=1903189 RepID=A0A8H3G241_9LECA|nr:MAG: hypothetical protein ALECFALPRED_006343 [Alectoria fallacina]
MYGHPVMILHPIDENNFAVCILTTLNDRDIELQKHPFDNEFYLAIYPKEPPCVYLYPQLCLDQAVLLRKPSYLCIRERHSVHRSMLEPYEKGKAADSYKLSWSSYMIVANTFE